jgi:O-succinylbenzoate synthase
VVSSALETSVGMAAEIALAAALPRLDYACGLGTGALLTADVVPPDVRLTPRDGFLLVSRSAPEPAARQTVAAAPERTTWWLDRLERVRRVVRRYP